MSVVFVVTDGGMEYTTSIHPSDEMMWYISHHSVGGKAGALTATECSEFLLEFPTEFRNSYEFQDPMEDSAAQVHRQL